MKELFKRLFKKRQDKINLDNINKEKFYLSIHMDREDENSIIKMHRFTDLLNNRNIKYETFTPEVSLISKNDSRYYPFTICVDLYYENDLKQIHKKVYDFEL